MCSKWFKVIDLVEDQQDDIAILENALQMIDVSYLFTTSFYYKAP